MIPKDSIARTPISTASFVKSYALAGTPGTRPNGNDRQNARAKEILKFSRGM
jgi:hypothetical protein